MLMTRKALAQHKQQKHFCLYASMARHQSSSSSTASSGDKSATPAASFRRRRMPVFCQAASAEDFESHRVVARRKLNQKEQARSSRLPTIQGPSSPTSKSSWTLSRTSHKGGPSAMAMAMAIGSMLKLEEIQIHNPVPRDRTAVCSSLCSSRLLL